MDQPAKTSVSDPLASLAQITKIDDNYLDSVVVEPPPEIEEDKSKKKKVKLTKAEKKALKIQQMIDFRKLEIRSHFLRELELSRKSEKKVLQEWEDICKEIKIVELRDELKEWDAKTIRILEAKDEKIEFMNDLISDTYEMYNRAIRKHMKILDYMEATYQCLANSAFAVHRGNTQAVIEDFLFETAMKKKGIKAHKINLENFLHSSNLVAEHTLKTDYQIFLRRRDLRVNTEIERRYRHRDQVVVKMKETRQLLLSFIHNLLGASLEESKYENIQVLMDRQRVFWSESSKLNEIEFRNTRLYADLQRDLLHIEVDGQRKVNELKLENAYFLQVRKGIENNMDRDRMITFHKLKIMSSISYNVIKKYKELEKYGELLLSVTAYCRKLESEQEKAHIWGTFQQYKDFEFDKNDMEQRLQLKVVDITRHLDISEEELDEQIRLMRNFWRRMCMVEATNLMLKREKTRLTEENQTYQCIIRRMSKSDNEEDLLATVKVSTKLCEAVEIPCLNFLFKRRRILNFK